jgi:hypothetical protein
VPASVRAGVGEVLIGREPALRQLHEALAAAAAGQGRLVTVSGEPGIGKTSLLCRFAEVAGVPVLRATCPEHVAAPPLWLWDQVLRDAGTWFPHLAAPAQQNGPQTEPDDGDILRRFEAIVEYLTGAASVAPLVVLLDHLHRADQTSLRLLAHLADSVPASRLLLVVSFRSDESATLGETLAAFARSGVTRIELDGLNVQETQALAAAILHQEVDRQTAEALWARTEGNPFFLREIVKLSTGAGPHPVPVPVRDVVLRHVAGLPPAAAEVLAVAAVAGRHFDIEVVAEAATVEFEAVLAGLDAAVAAGLLVEDQHRLGWFRFTHALAVEVLYGTTGRLRRARLHRRIGAAAARAWAGNTERAAEVARHWLLAAELDPVAAAHAATHAAAAARAADARLAFDDAATLWHQALTATDLAATSPPTTDLAGAGDLDRHPLLIGLGTSLCRAGNLHDGLPVFIQAMEETLDADDTGGGEPDTARLVTTAVTAISELHWDAVDDADAGNHSFLSIKASRHAGRRYGLFASLCPTVTRLPATTPGRMRAEWRSHPNPGEPARRHKLHKLPISPSRMPGRLDRRRGMAVRAAIRRR